MTVEAEKERKKRSLDLAKSAMLSFGGLTEGPDREKEGRGMPKQGRQLPIEGTRSGKESLSAQIRLTERFPMRPLIG